MANIIVNSKVYIGTPSATQTTDTYTRILGITDVGEHGDEPEIVKVQTIDSKRPLKLKGTVDGGTFEFTVTREMGDAGQIALRAAAATDAEYNLKIEADDKPAGASAKPTTQYLRGLVSVKHKHGGANDTFSQTFVFEITAAPVTVPASAT